MLQIVIVIKNGSIHEEFKQKYRQYEILHLTNSIFYSILRNDSLFV